MTRATCLVPADAALGPRRSARGTDSVVATGSRAARRARAMSVRTRLVIIVVVIDVVTALLTGAVMVLKGRSATQLEIASAMRLAQSLASDTIRLMQDAPPAILLQSLDLQFQSVRHVRISVTDTSGRPLSLERTMQQASSRGERPPAWFLALATPEIERKTFPIVVHGRDIGSATVISAPGDEIGEAWTYTHALIATATALNLVVLAVLFVLFGRVLAPLTALAKGLEQLEEKNFAIRLPRPSIAELASLTDHFNRTAEALASARGDNSALHRRLLTAQDDERRRIALELHDEAGPCLFALEASATSIATQTRGQDALARVHERALDVVALVGRVQSINRRVLDRLRPMALGRIPLRESLVKLVVDLDGRDHGPDITESIGGLRDGYGCSIDLTIYRCAQEGLFNAVRHAFASRIRLEVHQDGPAEAPGVALRVIDDGRGLPEATRAGFGLAGMRERVEALDGRFSIASTGAGTTLDIFVPIDQPTAGAAEE